MFNLISFCTLDIVTDFKLDPPTKAKSQSALISVTDVIDQDEDSAERLVKTLLVDNVQLLTPEEAEVLKKRLSKMFYFAALAGSLPERGSSSFGPLKSIQATL